jgi:hypothetical protein
MLMQKEKLELSSYVCCRLICGCCIKTGTHLYTTSTRKQTTGHVPSLMYYTDTVRYVLLTA